MKNKSQKLRELIYSKTLSTAVGAFDAVSAKLSENHGFNAIWGSGLCISSVQGVPDRDILSMTELLQVVNSMNLAVDIPILVDCDTGFGSEDNLIRLVRLCEAYSIAGICIEDKTFPKKNSFATGKQQLEDIDKYCRKIEVLKQNQINKDFVVAARTEAFISGAGLEEALKRAYAYVEAGADAIVVHSKKNSPEEIYSFSKEWVSKTPLIAIPTTYHCVTESELQKMGYSLCIYANHILRAYMQAANQTLTTLKDVKTCNSLESNIASVQEVLAMEWL